MNMIWMTRKEILHPYLGYVRQAKEEANQYGFYAPKSLPKNNPHKVNIAIVGGSVACLFAIWGKDTFINELKSSSLFKNKNIEVINLALGGYKQPQQLLVINYFLVLGAKFDIVINIDGYNELVLPICENIPQNIPAIFPRAWYWRIQKIPDYATKSFIAKIIYFREKKAELAQFFLCKPFNYSISANFLWKICNYHFANKINKYQQIRYDYSSSQKSQQKQNALFKNDFQLYQHLTDIWAISSMQLAKLCHSNNISYFHFLQPNQYVLRSKIISNEEKKVAYLEKNNLSCECIRRGYPKLIKRGKQLIKNGVVFTDATMIFSDTKETLYYDRQCHFNKKGNKILAKKISKVILESMKIK